MSDGPTIPPPAPGGSSSLVTRAINILTKPAAEWSVIDGEAVSNGKLIGGYAAILALIAVVAVLLSILITPYGTVLFGQMGFLIKLLLITYAMALIPPIVLGFALDALAPSLGGTKSGNQAMKLAIYSGTAYWVGAVGLILSPWLWLVLGVGYAGYLLWVGAPILMRVATDKAPVFVAASVGILVVTYIILNMIAQRIIWGALVGGMYGM